MSRYGAGISIRRESTAYSTTEDRRMWMAVKLTWRGKEVTEAVKRNVAQAMGEFALRVEGNSKRQLRRGHGVLTGTLRRSIHTAQEGYKWGSDNVEPASGTPELGNRLNVATVDGKRISIQVGSGLVYAMAIHQGWPEGYKNMKGSFEGYHYITNGLAQTKKELPAILRKYRLEKS